MVWTAEAQRLEVRLVSTIKVKGTGYSVGELTIIRRVVPRSEVYNSTTYAPLPLPLSRVYELRVGGAVGGSATGAGYPKIYIVHATAQQRHARRLTFDTVPSLADELRRLANEDRTVRGVIVANAIIAEGMQKLGYTPAEVARGTRVLAGSTTYVRAVEIEWTSTYVLSPPNGPTVSVRLYAPDWLSGADSKDVAVEASINAYDFFVRVLGGNQGLATLRVASARVAQALRRALPGASAKLPTLDPLNFTYRTGVPMDAARPRKFARRVLDVARAAARAGEEAGRALEEAMKEDGWLFSSLTLLTASGLRGRQANMA